MGNTVIAAEAVAIVHAGLADELARLGEEPQTPHVPRHASPWVELGYVVSPNLGAGRVLASKVGTPAPGAIL